jgi:threonine dehydrogenase-like Zn-dependent dehydrogenase
MKAVVLHEYGGPEKLKFEDNVPEPPMSGGTVLIAAAAASVNPIDWKLRSGIRQKDSPLSFPAILDRDVSGVVRAVGANVKHFKTGDRVLALSKATYAELVAVDDSDVTHLPDGVGLADAGRDPGDFPHGRPACAPCDKREKGTGCSDNGSAGQCWARGSAYGEEDRRAGDCRCSRERAG